jgi:hypothetical protein
VDRFRQAISPSASRKVTRTDLSWVQRSPPLRRARDERNTSAHFRPSAATVEARPNVSVHWNFGFRICFELRILSFEFLTH